MDTSEEYIEMCRAAKEIQTQWTPSIGDFHINQYCLGSSEYNNDIRTLKALESNEGQPFDKDYKVWLPRQDQLQDMCPDFNKFKPIDSLSFVTSWSEEGAGYECGANDYVKSFDSLEQVWLAYVMDELYHMKWNGSEWV